MSKGSISRDDENSKNFHSILLQSLMTLVHKKIMNFKSKDITFFSLDKGINILLVYTKIWSKSKNDKTSYWDTKSVSNDWTLMDSLSIEGLNRLITWIGRLWIFPTSLKRNDVIPLVAYRWLALCLITSPFCIIGRWCSSCLSIKFGWTPWAISAETIQKRQDIEFRNFISNIKLKSRSYIGKTVNKIHIVKSFL